MSLSAVQEIQALIQRQHELGAKHAEALNVLRQLLDVVSQEVDDENAAARLRSELGHDMPERMLRSLLPAP